MSPSPSLCSSSAHPRLVSSPSQLSASGRLLLVHSVTKVIRTWGELVPDKVPNKEGKVLRKGTHKREEF